MNYTPNCVVITCARSYDGIFAKRCTCKSTVMTSLDDKYEVQLNGCVVELLKVIPVSYNITFLDRKIFLDTSTAYLALKYVYITLAWSIYRHT